MQTKEIEIWITRKNKPLKINPPIFEKKIFKSGEESKVRVFISLKEKKGFTLHVKNKESKSKIIIPRRRL